MSQAVNIPVNKLLSKVASERALCCACAEGFPRFRTPGVERVFSAADKMHDDLKKSATAGTLEMSLFAMQNTD